MANEKSKYYKHPKYGHVYGEAIKTPIGRLTFPHLLEPKAAPPPKEGEKQGEPRYEITQLIDPSSDYDAFMAKLEPMIKEMLVMFNDKRPAKLGECVIVPDGNDLDPDKYTYFKDKFVLCARNSQKDFKVVGPDKAIIDGTLIKSGIIGQLVVTPMITTHGVKFKLNIVQLKLDDGVRIGGGIQDHLKLLDDGEEPDALAEPVAGAPADAKDAVVDVL